MLACMYVKGKIVNTYACIYANGFAHLPHGLGRLVLDPSEHISLGANGLCFKQFQNSKELPSFLKSFWELQKSDQDSFVPRPYLFFYWCHSTLAGSILSNSKPENLRSRGFLQDWSLPKEWFKPKVQLCLATTNDNRDKQFTLLDKPVGFKCLAALLGVGTGRLRRGMSGAPDLRHGQRPYMSKASTWSVDGFLRIAYDAVAETLPDQLLGFVSFIFGLSVENKPWKTDPA